MFNDDVKLLVINEDENNNRHIFEEKVSLCVYKNKTQQNPSHNEYIKCAKWVKWALYSR